MGKVKKEKDCQFIFFLKVRLVRILLKRLVLGPHGARILAENAPIHYTVFCRINSYIHRGFLFPFIIYL